VDWLIKNLQLRAEPQRKKETGLLRTYNCGRNRQFAGGAAKGTKIKSDQKI